MPRRCTICTHANREAIDRRLVEGDAFPAITALYRDTSADALGRHKAAHLPAALARAMDAAATAHGDDLLADLVALQARTLTILAAAEQQDKLSVALAAIREARGNLELFARLTQQLDTRPTINLLVAPEWLAVRTLLLEALWPFPEARAAVAGRLAALETM